MSVVSRLAESERQFQTRVLQFMRRSGWLVAHFHDSRRQVTAGRFVGDTDAVGFPDVFATREERVIAAELKAEKGRVTPAQQRWLAALEATGRVETYVWRPSDWETIVKLCARSWPMTRAP